MSSTDRKGLLKRILTVNVSGCGCGKPRSSDVIQPKPLPKPSSSPPRSQSKPKIHRSPSSSCDKYGGLSVDDEDLTSTTFSSNSSADEAEAEIKGESTISRIGNSISVVKESDDPYRDFRDSMEQMVLEKEIYSRDGLEELLSRFLELNPPQHHESIVRAFTEVWNVIVVPEKEKIKKKKTTATATVSLIRETRR